MNSRHPFGTALMALLLTSVTAMVLPGKALAQAPTKEADLAKRLEVALKEAAQAKAEADELRARLEQERKRADQAAQEARAQRDAAQAAEAQARRQLEQARAAAEAALLEAQKAQQATQKAPPRGKAPEEALARALADLEREKAKVMDQFALRRAELQKQQNILDEEQQQVLAALEQKAKALRQAGAGHPPAERDKLDQVLERLERIEKRLDQLEKSKANPPQRKR
jgi:hypothetical protein